MKRFEVELQPLISGTLGRVQAADEIGDAACLKVCWLCYEIAEYGRKKAGSNEGRYDVFIIMGVFAQGVMCLVEYHDSHPITSLGSIACRRIIARKYHAPESNFSHSVLSSLLQVFESNMRF